RLHSLQLENSTVGKEGRKKVPLPSPSRSETSKEDSQQSDLVVNDVALQALVILTQQNPDDYGFPPQGGDPERRTVSNAPGFSNDTDRRNAMARWLSWRTDHANQLKKTPLDASEGVGG